MHKILIVFILLLLGCSNNLTNKEQFGCSKCIEWTKECDDLCKCEEEQLSPEGDEECKKFIKQHPNESCFVLIQCLKSRPKTDQEKHPEDYVAENECIEEVKAFSDKIYIKCLHKKGCNKWNDSDMCILSVNPCIDDSIYYECTQNLTTYRPKTECEKKYFVEGKRVLVGDNSIDGFYQICLKGSYEGEQCWEGNPDWVEETQLLQYSCISKYKNIEATYNKIGKYSETWNKNLHIYYCNSDLDCDWLDCSDEKAGTLYCLKELYQNDKSLIEGDFYNGSCQTKYQTICREKTDVEKLMNKDCDWLHDTIDTYTNLDKYSLENLKQAWRQKGCEI